MVHDASCGEGGRTSFIRQATSHTNVDAWSCSGRGRSAAWFVVRDAVNSQAKALNLES